ncbi:MAG: hypothetical protein IPG93_24710 [Burkholderiales bacterium]|nr:hypothetical protein [Burkholderiales bacterium]
MSEHLLPHSSGLPAPASAQHSTALGLVPVAQAPGPSGDGPCPTIAEQHALFDAALRAVQQQLSATPADTHAAPSNDAQTGLAGLRDRITTARTLLYYSPAAHREMQAKFKRLAVDCGEQEQAIGATLSELRQAADAAWFELCALEDARDSAGAAAPQSKQARAIAAAPINAAKLRWQQCSWALTEAQEAVSAAAMGRASYMYAAKLFEVVIAYADMTIATLEHRAFDTPQAPRLHLPANVRMHAPTWSGDSGEIPVDLVQRSVLAMDVDYEALIAECRHLLQGAAQPAACTT